MGDHSDGYAHYNRKVRKRPPGRNASAAYLEQCSVRTRADRPERPAARRIAAIPVDPLPQKAERENEKCGERDRFLRDFEVKSSERAKTQAIRRHRKIVFERAISQEISSAFHRGCQWPYLRRAS
jgi:hypothetical protein